MPACTGQTSLAPEIEQVGGGLTVKTTSSLVKLFAHAPASVTVRRNVAVAGAGPLTCTVAGKVMQPVPQEVGASMVAPWVEETTVHVKDWIVLLPGWAVPLRVKVVVPLGATQLV